MRFIIPAQAGAERETKGQQSDFDVELFKAIRQLTGPGDLPPEILKLITQAAPIWSAAAWQSE